MAWMVNVATIAARYNHTHILNALFEYTRVTDVMFSLLFFLLYTLSLSLSMQSSVSGSPHSAVHRHVHVQRTFSGWRQTAAKGYSQQCLQKQVIVCPELPLKIQKIRWHKITVDWFMGRNRSVLKDNKWDLNIGFYVCCSMEVGVRAEAYQEDGPNRHINSAFMTFEVLNDHRKPCTLPRIRPEPLVSQTTEWTTDGEHIKIF